ncbi:MAG: zinc ABC transporter substrate-binding protein [Clostridiaceae bacterium]|nr:zinc ABC transporter substrate-binding protein [Clostridiaceae bacterium]
MAMTVVILILAACFTGCGNDDRGAENQDETGKVSVCASFYVMYDFAGKIGGDKVTVTNLLPAGSDPHTWEPSPRDIVNIQNADVLVYNGAGMERWIDKVLASIENDDITTVDASMNVKLLEVKLQIPGREPVDEEQGHGHVYDPHVWLDPSRAKIQMRAITDAFIEADPENKDYYEKNYEHYAKELDKLDDEYREAAARFTKKDVVVSHAAFGYLCDAYGLNQVAVSGLDGESEPTGSRMVDVSDFIKENRVGYVFVDKHASAKVMESISKSTGARMEVLNPVASLSPEEIKAGKDYFMIMRENLEVLKKALN